MWFSERSEVEKYLIFLFFMQNKKILPSVFIFFNLRGRENTNCLNSLFFTKIKNKVLEIDTSAVDSLRAHNLLVYNSVISQKFFEEEKNFTLKNYKRMVRNCLLVFRGAIYLNRKFIIVDSGEQEYIFKLYYLLYGYNTITKYSNFFFL